MPVKVILMMLDHSAAYSWLFLLIHAPTVPDISPYSQQTAIYMLFFCFKCMIPEVKLLILMLTLSMFMKLDSP